MLEILQEALVRNLESFARFLEVAAIINGQVVNVAASPATRRSRDPLCRGTSVRWSDLHAPVGGGPLRVWPVQKCFARLAAGDVLG